MKQEKKDWIDELRLDFYSESHELIDLCENHLRDFNSERDYGYLQQLIRGLHALKGSADGAGFDEYGLLVKELERNIVPDLMLNKNLNTWIALVNRALDQFHSLSAMLSEHSTEIVFEENKLKQTLSQLKEMVLAQK